MKKLLVVLLVVIAAGIAAAPALVGVQAQKRYQSLLDDLQSEDLQVVRNEYHRGWLHSTAEAEFELALKDMARRRSSRDQADLALLPEKIRFTLSNRIVHGPLLIDELRRGEIKPVQAVMDTRVLFHGESVFPEDYPVSIQTRLAFDGQGHTTLSGPARSQAVAADRPGIRFDGLEGSVDFAPGLNSAAMRFAMPLFRIETVDGATMDVRSVEIASDVARGVGGLMFGEGRFVIAAIEARDGNSGQTLRIDQIRAEGGSAETGGNVTLTARYSVQVLDVNGENYAPSVIGMRFERLPAEPLAALSGKMESIQRQRPSEEQMQFMLISAMAEALPALLANDPLFALEPVNITTPQGGIDARFSVTTRGVTGSDIAALGGLLNKVTAEAELRIPEALVRDMLVKQALLAGQRQQLPGTVPPADDGEPAAEPPSQEELQKTAEQQAEQQIDTALQQSFAVREGQHLATVARLERGQLTVNGKSFPLGGMMGQPGVVPGMP